VKNLKGHGMLIGERIRALRISKKLSQGHIEERSGLLRCYISRVENGHTVPSIDTLEKISRAVEVPLYQFFYEGTNAVAPDLPKAPKFKESPEFARLRNLFPRVNRRDQQLLVNIASRMAGRRRSL